MGFNFPSSPTIGQLHPPTSTPGLPQYTWDGVTWILKGTPINPVIIVSDTPPASPVNGTMWWNGVNGKLFVYYFDGDSSAWVQAAASLSDVDQSQLVKRAGDTMAGPLVLAADPVADMQAVTRRYVDARTDNNLLVNGFMDISQEFAYGSSQSSPSSTYIADQWMANCGGAAFTTTNYSISGGGADPSGIYRTIGLASPAGYAPASTHNAYFAQPIEGYRFSKAGWGAATGLPVSVGFWVYSNVGGVMTATMRDWNPISRSYCIPITVPAGQWVYRTATFPACPDGANWKIDNTAAATLFLSFLATASLLASAANTWLSGNFIVAPTATNMFTAGTQANYITGVTMVLGTMPVPQAQCQYLRRDMGFEKLLCRRFFQYETFTDGAFWLHPIDLGNIYRRRTYHFIPEMRAAPTMTVTGGTSGTPAAGHPQAMNANPWGVELQCDLTGAGYAFYRSIKASARF
jgi:hypothetical protein